MQILYSLIAGVAGGLTVYLALLVSGRLRPESRAEAPTPPLAVHEPEAQAVPKRRGLGLAYRWVRRRLLFLDREVDLDHQPSPEYDRGAAADPTEQLGTELAPTEQLGDQPSPTEQLGTELAPTELLGAELAPTEYMGADSEPTQRLAFEAAPTEHLGALDGGNPRRSELGAGYGEDYVADGGERPIGGRPLLAAGQDGDRSDARAALSTGSGPAGPEQVGPHASDPALRLQGDQRFELVPIGDAYLLMRTRGSLPAWVGQVEVGAEALPLSPSARQLRVSDRRGSFEEIQLPDRFMPTREIDGDFSITDESESRQRGWDIVHVPGAMLALRDPSGLRARSTTFTERISQMLRLVSPGLAVSYLAELALDRESSTLSDVVVACSGRSSEADEMKLFVAASRDYSLEVDGVDEVVHRAGRTDLSICDYRRTEIVNDGGARLVLEPVPEVHSNSYIDLTEARHNSDR